MDSLHFVIAIGPLAMYLLLLGSINLSSRPLVTTGGRDLAALAIGISGFVIAGPMELFLPEAFAAAFGWVVWLLMILCYALIVLLIVLLSRPRLVIYNISTEQLRPTLVEVVSRLDPDARWAGESAVLPNLGMQFSIEPFPALKNVQLKSAGPQSHLEGWGQLEGDLVASLRAVRTGANPYGFSLATFGVMLTAVITYWLIRDPGGIAQSLDDMLGIDQKIEGPVDPPPEELKKDGAEKNTPAPKAPADKNLIDPPPAPPPEEPAQDPAP